MNRIILLSLVCLSFSVCRADDIAEGVSDLVCRSPQCKLAVKGKGEILTNEQYKSRYSDTELKEFQEKELKLLMRENERGRLVRELAFSELVNLCEDAMEYKNQKEITYVHLGKNIELTFTGCKIEKFRKEVEK